MHVFGEVLGATGFGAAAVRCDWQLHVGPAWVVARGDSAGRTQAGMPNPDGGEMALWAHPVDVELHTDSLQGWPRFVFTLFRRDAWVGRDEFVAYSTCSVPLSPGMHAVSCPTWRANDRHSLRNDEHAGFYTGQHPELVNPTFVHDREEALLSAASTVGMGTVHLQLCVIFRDMHKPSVHTGGLSLRRSRDEQRRTMERSSRHSELLSQRDKEREEQLRLSSGLASVRRDDDPVPDPPVVRRRRDSPLLRAESPSMSIAEERSSQAVERLAKRLQMMGATSPQISAAAARGSLQPLGGESRQDPSRGGFGFAAEGVSGAAALAGGWRSPDLTPIGQQGASSSRENRLEQLRRQRNEAKQRQLDAAGPSSGGFGVSEALGERRSGGSSGGFGVSGALRDEERYS